MSTTRNGREFTGRHMFFIMVAFFGVIISVNLTMAMLARSSWTGLVVKNTYVASREFNDLLQRAKAQAALHWREDVTITGDSVRVALADADGRTIRIDGATAVFRKPISDAKDVTVALKPEADGSAAAPMQLHDGLWNVEILAEAGLDHPYRVVRRIVLVGGRLQ